MNRKSLTLIELVVVVTIIFILAGFVAGAAQMARRRALVVEAKTQIATMELALSMYEVDFGSYPDDGIANLVDKLSNETAYGAGVVDDWNGPYMRFREDDLDGSNNFLDPWSNAYQYDKEGTHNGASYYDLYSYGPGGDSALEAEWIKNW